MNNIQTVKHLYELFQRGDIAAIVNNFADDIVWEYAPTSANIPWLAPRKGKMEAAGFFETLGQLDMTHFQVNNVVGNDQVVVGLCTVHATVKATGKKLVETDEVHVWYFNDAGKVSRFRHAVDTYNQAKALER